MRAAADPEFQRVDARAALGIDPNAEPAAVSLEAGAVQRQGLDQRRAVAGPFRATACATTR